MTPGHLIASNVFPCCKAQLGPYIWKMEHVDMHPKGVMLGVGGMVLYSLCKVSLISEYPYQPLRYILAIKNLKSDIETSAQDCRKIKQNIIIIKAISQILKRLENAKNQSITHAI